MQNAIWWIHYSFKGVYGTVYAWHHTVVNKGLVSFVTILYAEKKFIGELMKTVDTVSGTFKISIDD